MITAQSIREKFDYDSISGALTRKKYQKKVGWIENTGYRRIEIDGEKYLASFIIWMWMTGKEPIESIDHKNGNRSDDRWINLREANGRQNRWNSKTPTNNQSGIKGVYRDKRCSKKPWVASITANHERIVLGWFSTLQEAKTARTTVENTHHGKFRRTS